MWWNSMPPPKGTWVSSTVAIRWVGGWVGGFSIVLFLLCLLDISS